MKNLIYFRPIHNILNITTNFRAKIFLLLFFFISIKKHIIKSTTQKKGTVDLITFGVVHTITRIYTYIYMYMYVLEKFNTYVGDVKISCDMRS